MKKKRSFRLLFFLIFLFCLSVFSVYIADRIVENNAVSKTYNSCKTIPKNKTGLLLGTSKYLSNGHLNLYYKYRIDAAVKLYKSGKIKFILISGDNSTKDYDEPTSMKNDLIKRGIPASKIFLDYAGFRTYDSVVRAKEIFGQNSITVISQQFHNERAVYIAEKKGIKAVGCNAKSVNLKYGFKTRIRERLARVKMILDLIFNKKPKYLGKKIKIK